MPTKTEETNKRTPTGASLTSKQVKSMFTVDRDAVLAILSERDAALDALRAYVAWQLGKGTRPNIEDARALLAEVSR